MLAGPSTEESLCCKNAMINPAHAHTHTGRAVQWQLGTSHLLLSLQPCPTPPPQLGQVSTISSMHKQHRAPATQVKKSSACRHETVHYSNRARSSKPLLCMMRPVRAHTFMQPPCQSAWLAQTCMPKQSSVLLHWATNYHPLPPPTGPPKAL